MEQDLHQGRNNQNRKKSNRPKQASHNEPSKKNNDDAKQSSGKSRNRNRNRKRGKKPENQKTEKPYVHVAKNYGIIFFDTLEEAKKAIEEIKTTADKYDQLNIVIRAESDMYDPELTQYGKVFAGEAWTLIHERRVEDGWYNEPR